MIHARTLTKSLHRKRRTPADLIADIKASAENEQRRFAEEYPEMADDAWRDEVMGLARAEGWTDFGFSGWAGLGFTERRTCWDCFTAAKVGPRVMYATRIIRKREAA
jgi:hypothetical protein